MTGTRFRLMVSRLVAVFAVAALIIGGALWWIFSGDGNKRVTAYFTRAVGVYAGSDVRLLGVRIGQIESVTPHGEQVTVTMTVSADAGVAADTGALVVAPSIVADRYLQFTKLAGRGPRITDGAVIPVAKTGTPVELDELYSSLNTLTTALGPKGANRNGALSELLNTGAANLNGNGQSFNASVRNLADLARTLGDSKNDLFGTVDQLQRFTTALAGNDSQVRGFNSQLSAVSDTLAANRTELAGALNTLGTALGQVQTFIRDNRALVKSNVDNLAQTTQQLVDHRASVAEALDIAPNAVTNLLNAFDPKSGTLQSRSDLPEYYGPPTSCPALPCQPLPPKGLSAVPDGNAPPTSAPPLPLPVSGSTYTDQGGAK